jgi:hypothetical protein
MTPGGLMLRGLGMAALGGVLTAVTYAGAGENSGVYYVFTGLFVFGGINFVRGLYYFIRSQRRSEW